MKWAPTKERPFITTKELIRHQNEDYIDIFIDIFAVKFEYILLDSKLILELTLKKIRNHFSN